MSWLRAEWRHEIEIAVAVNLVSTSTTVSFLFFLFSTLLPSWLLCLLFHFHLPLYALESSESWTSFPCSFRSPDAEIISTSTDCPDFLAGPSMALMAACNIVLWSPIVKSRLVVLYPKPNEKVFLIFVEKNVLARSEVDIDPSGRDPPIRPSLRYHIPIFFFNIGIFNKCF